MQFMKSLFFTFLLLIASSLFVAAQPAPASGGSRTSSSKGEKFVSLEAGFSIDLPNSIRSYSGNKPIQGATKGGSNFSWQGQEGVFVIGYDDLLTPQNAFEVVRKSAEGFVADRVADGAKVLYNKEKTIDGNKGLEIRFGLASGSSMLMRYLLVNQKVFILRTVWAQGKDGVNEIKILDSFKVIDRKAIIVERLEEATPKPLPQTPAVKRKGSDANSEYLKGPVESVISSNEYLDGTGSVAGIKRTSDQHFDKGSYYTKIVEYDYRGNPNGVSVYGFIDGKRVSKRGAYIDYEYNPPSAMAPPGSAPKAEDQKPADDRYTSSYEYKYDSQNRLIEEISFNNRGEKNGRTTYTYEGNKVNRIYFNREDKPSSNALQIYDGRFNLMEVTYYSSRSQYPDDSHYSYIYLAFDEKGNWTKREVKGKSGRYGGGPNDSHFVEYRTITYYR